MIQTCAVLGAFGPEILFDRAETVSAYGSTYALDGRPIHRADLDGLVASAEAAWLAEPAAHEPGVRAWTFGPAFPGTERVIRRLERARVLVARAEAVCDDARVPVAIVRDRAARPLRVLLAGHYVTAACLAQARGRPADEFVRLAEVAWLLDCRHHGALVDLLRAAGRRERAAAVEALERSSRAAATLA